MKFKTLYRVTIQGPETVYEVYARNVCEAELFGFIALEELVFGETASLVIDPSQESVKSEFSGVKCTFIPMHNILRIDEIAENTDKYNNLNLGNNVSQFPPTIYNKVPDNLTNG